MALGASTIEKHYTLDRTMTGPDHPFAIEPDELVEMVENIRTTENCLGIKSSKTTTSEDNFLKATRSIVAKKKILKGQVISSNNITTKRPYLKNCVPAKEFYNLQDKYVAKKDMEFDELVTWNDIAGINE